MITSGSITKVVGYVWPVAISGNAGIGFNTIYVDIDGN